MEKALLSGGFDAIKWHIGNREMNREIGKVGIFVTNKIIIYTFFFRKHTQQKYSKCTPENMISSKTKLSPTLPLYAMKDCSQLFIAVSTQQVLGLSPRFSRHSCHHPYWLNDNYRYKLGCDWILAFVLQLARGTRGKFLR